MVEITKETQRWDLPLDKKKADKIGYLPAFFNDWAIQEARARGHRFIRTRNYAEKRSAQKIVLSGDVDLEVNVRFEEVRLRHEEAKRQRALREETIAAPFIRVESISDGTIYANDVQKIAQPERRTLRWQLAMDEREFQDKFFSSRAVMVTEIAAEAYFTDIARRDAEMQNQGERVVAVQNFRIDSYDYERKYRMMADLVLEKVPDNALTVEKMRAVMEMMKQADKAPIWESWDRQVRSAYIEESAFKKYMLMEPRPGDLDGAVGAVMFKPLLPATPPPPEPVQVVRRLDLDDTIEIAQPATTGRKIDLD